MKKPTPKNLRRCFVMQPFDKGRFDGRFEGVFKPAIEAARLEAYRVDRDPGVNIPIERIEQGIAESLACFAEITTDNPNVWYEVGYAMAMNKPTCMVCSSERRTPFPFDVRHRHIIKYRIGAKSFRQLRRQITERLNGALETDAGRRSLHGQWLSSWPDSAHRPSSWIRERVDIQARSGGLVLRNSRNSKGYRWEAEGDLYEGSCFHGTFRSRRPGATIKGVLTFYVLQQGDAIVGQALCPDSQGRTIYSTWAMGRREESLEKAKLWIEENSSLLGTARRGGKRNLRDARRGATP